MCSGIVYLVVLVDAVVLGSVVDAVVLAELLELAVAASYAGEALSVVSRENELESLLAGLDHLRRIGNYLHIGRAGINAACNEAEASALVYLSNADTAGANLVYLLHVAKCGDLKACDVGSLKNSSTLGDGDLNTMNFNCDIFH